MKRKVVATDTIPLTRVVATVTRVVATVTRAVQVIRAARATRAAQAVETRTAPATDISANILTARRAQPRRNATEA